MSLNKVQLIGQLGADAVVRNAGSMQVANFSVATSERYVDRQGNVHETTEWHQVELWGNGGVYQYLLKGQQVYVEGSIKTDVWRDQNGVERQTKKIRSSTVQLLGRRPDSQGQQQAQQPAYGGRAARVDDDF